ncbi:DNA cytosine methyltransferase [Paenibacillus sp. FSL M7-1455]|uniref:DNA cytosine methyltransferase n=1 Tax=Paenibacillus sp. FSL M7-1455 TaxID=2975316 RepID=UPI0030F642B3
MIDNHNTYQTGERKETVPIRNYNVTPELPPNGLTVAELFCGGGLMAVGLKAAGYDLIFANDFDKRATQAYAHNIGDHVVCGDITSAEIQSQIPDADIIAGGPPCQDYSVAGSGVGEAGERGRLVWTYLDIIARKQPKAFVFENVKGLITKRHRPTFDALLAEFDRIGYAVSWRLINAWDYGVAQKRERVFIVGIRKDLGFAFEFPEPTADEYRTQVLRDVIGDLPEPNMGVNAHVQTQATTVKRTEGVYNQRAYKAEWDAPAKTVCTNRLDHAEIHPTQPRRFTVRECLRIQSVPDWYVLPDTISLSAQYRIVGNGVASRVAYRIGEALASQLSVALAEQLNAALAGQTKHERRAA